MYYIQRECFTQTDQSCDEEDFEGSLSKTQIISGKNVWRAQRTQCTRSCAHIPAKKNVFDELHAGSRGRLT